MPKFTKEIVEYWGATAATSLDAAGVERDQATNALVGRTLARIGRTFGGSGPGSPTDANVAQTTAPSIDSHTATAAYADFIAAMGRFARE
jgi:hypothetical protein